MENDYKYLKDGRKVAVISDLNDNEVIVQEVFKTSKGEEFIEGDKFTANKSKVLDEPRMSWQERECNTIKSELKELEEERRKTLSDMRLLREEKKGHQQIVAHNLKLIDKTEKLGEEDIDLISSVATGDIKWIVYNNEWWKPRLFDNEVFYFNDRYRRPSFRGIRMITMFGDSKGEFRFEIKTLGKVEPVQLFKTDEEMKEYLSTAMLDNKEIVTEEIIESLSSFITIPQSIIEELYLKRIKEANKQKDNSMRTTNELFDKSIKNALDFYKDQCIKKNMYEEIRDIWFPFH